MKMAKLIFAVEKLRVEREAVDRARLTVVRRTSELHLSGGRDNIAALEC